MSAEAGRVRNVLHPVADVAAATTFYAETLGFGETFTDGTRYAALDAGDVTLALAGPGEDITDGVAAASVKVADVEVTVTAFTRAGGTLVRPPEAGPHETRAVLRDPWGNTLIAYAPR